MEKDAVKFTVNQVRALKRIAQEKKLKGADVLNEYTDEQMAQAFNGAGGVKTPEWQRWTLTQILKKKLPAILIHDIEYLKGGKEKDFLRSNDNLRDNILALDNDDKSKWWQFVARKAKEWTNEYGRPGWKAASSESF